MKNQKNNLKDELLSRYENLYFNKLTPDQQKQGNRFLISPCPDTADDVQLLFLNLNPKNGKEGEKANKPCMQEEGIKYWFDEGWPKSRLFRNLFYVIGEKLNDLNWSYLENYKSIDWDNLTSKKIYSKTILSAYAYPLRTNNVGDLKKNHKNAILSAKDLWDNITDLLPEPLKIIITGNTPFDMICRMLEAETTKYFKLKWGSNLSLKYAETNNEKKIKILCFPQVSRFPLISSKKLTNDVAKTIDDAFDYLLK